MYIEFKCLSTILAIISSTLIYMPKSFCNASLKQTKINNANMNKQIENMINEIRGKSKKRTQNIKNSKKSEKKTNKKEIKTVKNETKKEENPSFVTKFLTKNDCYSEGLKNLKNKKPFVPKGIMIHSTASPGIMAKDWYEKWNKSYENKEINRQACVHFFVDDKSVYHYLPCNFVGWHCGGKGNRIYISIEMCEPSGIPYNESNSEILEDYERTKSKNLEYYKKAYKNLIWLCCSLCKTFNFSVKKPSNPKAKLVSEKYNIISHKEGNACGVASNHEDPDHIWKFHGLTMDSFRDEVIRGLKEGNGRILEGLNFVEKQKENSEKNKVSSV